MGKLTHTQKSILEVGNENGILINEQKKHLENIEILLRLLEKM